MNESILTFGTDVFCIEDKCGKLARAAFDPDNWRVMELVVEEGLLLKRARVFPYSAVTEANDEAVTLDIHQDDLNGYPEYAERIVEKAPEGGPIEPALVHGSPHGLATSSPVTPMVREVATDGVADHLTLVDRDTSVEATDQTVGKVRGLAVEPSSGLITHVLVHRGTIFVDEFWVSALSIEKINSNGVFLTVSEAELNDRVEYDETREYYWNRMPTDEPLEQAASESQIRPNGKASSESVLTDNAALAAEVAETLSNEPRTCDAVIEVVHAQGMITLKGHVDSPETKGTAGEIAAAHPDVISVINELVVENQ